MSWSTELYCNISFNRESYNSLYEVESKIEDLNDLIEGCKSSIKDYMLMTEPNKMLGTENSPYNYLIEEYKLLMEELEEYTIDRYKLYLLKSNWKACHNKEGKAINPPEDIKPYLCGDFVNSVDYPIEYE